MRRTQIAKYRTERGALRYAAELSKAWPSVTFDTEIHPWDFGFTVIAFNRDELKHGAYVLRRPRGGPTVRHALI